MKPIVLAVLSFLCVAFAMAASSQDSGERKTEVNFADLLVRGKYSLSNEAVVTVEADKVLDSLLENKKDFNDRIRRSANR